MGTLGGPETTDGAAAVVTDGSAKPADASKPRLRKLTSETEIGGALNADLKQLLAECVEQADAQIAEISELREETASESARRRRRRPGRGRASRSLAARAGAMDKQTLVAMAKQKIDEEETANAKLKEALAAMEEVHRAERAEYSRRGANVRAAADTEAKRRLRRRGGASRRRARREGAGGEDADGRRGCAEHDERRVANLHAKLRDAAKLEQEMEEKKNASLTRRRTRGPARAARRGGSCAPSSARSAAARVGRRVGCRAEAAGEEAHRRAGRRGGGRRGAGHARPAAGRRLSRSHFADAKI